MDCGIKNRDKWFRYRAGAIIIEDRCVLLVKNEVDSYYYSVGGAVHIGETAEDAVSREVLEETGVKYQVDRLAFIHENFFKGSGTLEGLNCHEIAFYFLMKSKGTKELSSNSYSSLGPREYMHWLPIDKLNDYAAYPSFFAEKLFTLYDDLSVGHIITHQ